MAIWLILILVLFALLILNHYGMLTSEVSWFSLGVNWGLLSWWKGKYNYLTGRLARSFLVGQKYGALIVSVEREDGDLSVEVKRKDGSVLKRWQGGESTSFRFSIRGEERLRVRVMGQKFKGRFEFYMEPAVTPELSRW